MNIFASIRFNHFINKIIRNILRKSNSLITDIIKRWPTSGIVNCTFNNLNFKMINKCDDWLVDYFYYNIKYHGEGELNIFIRLSKYSSCIIDIGANTGLFSILSSKTNHKADIFAFEPYRANIERMKANIKLNNLTNIKVIEEAIGEKIGYIDISIPKNGKVTDVSSINIEFSKEVYPKMEWQKNRVPINTIDNFRNSLNKPINLIKCDVETLEVEVFKGLLKTINEDKPTIIFECYFNDKNVVFFNNILEKYNYYAYLVLPQGLVHLNEGFLNTNYDSINFLITPIKPMRTFISFKEESIENELMINLS